MWVLRCHIDNCGLSGDTSFLTFDSQQKERKEREKKKRRKKKEKEKNFISASTVSPCTEKERKKERVVNRKRKLSIP